VIGGETGKGWSEDLAATDDRVLLLGRKAENCGTFLFRLGFSEIGAGTEVAAAFPALLVLFLFGGSLFCYCFRLSRLIGILSSYSSVEMLSMGVDGMLLAGGEAVCMGISSATCISSTTGGGVCSICSEFP